MDELVYRLEVGALGFGVVAASLAYMNRSKPSSEEHQFRVAPAPGSSVTQVHVRSGNFIDRIEFVYTDGTRIGCGGQGGELHEPFILEPNEFIIAVRGRAGMFVDAVQFVTNTGRLSRMFGGPGGNEFEMKCENDQPVFGLNVEQAQHGWLASIVQVLPASAVLLTEQEQRRFQQRQRQIREYRERISAGDRSPVVFNGFVSNSRSRIRKNILQTALFVGSFLAFVVAIATPLARDVFRGPFPISSFPEHSFIFVEGSAKLVGSPFGGVDEIVVWLEVLQNSTEFSNVPTTLLTKSKTILVREAVPVDKWSNHKLAELMAHHKFLGVTAQLSPVLEDMAVVETLADTTARLSLKIESTTHFLNADFRPRYVGIFFVISVALLIAISYLVIRLIRGIDPVAIEIGNYLTQNLTLQELISQIDADLGFAIPENSSEESLPPNVFTYGRQRIAVSENWIACCHAYSFHAMKVADCIISNSRIFQIAEDGRVNNMVEFEIENRRVSEHRFRLRMPAHLYVRLERTFVSRVMAARDAINKQRATTAANELFTLLRQKQTNGNSLQRTDVSECLGACGRIATVSIEKQCTACEERDECLCDPGWCHICLLKWWLTQNQTKLEMNLPVELSWQARCPTCRVYFCLNDLTPLATAEITPEQEGEGHGFDALDQAATQQTNQTQLPHQQQHRQGQDQHGFEREREASQQQQPVQTTTQANAEIESNANSSVVDRDELRRKRLERLSNIRT